MVQLDSNIVQDKLCYLESYLSLLVLQVSIPLWALVHLPVVVTVTTAIFTPKGWLHCILYVLFENAMGIVKMGAVVAGECSAAPLYSCSAPSQCMKAMSDTCLSVCLFALAYQGQAHVCGFL